MCVPSYPCYFVVLSMRFYSVSFYPWPLEGEQIENLAPDCSSFIPVTQNTKQKVGRRKEMRG